MTRVPFKSTAQVEQQFHLTFGALHRMIGRREIAPPFKGPSDDYCWFPEDVARVEKALADRAKIKPGRSRTRASAAAQTASV